MVIYFVFSGYSYGCDFKSSTFLDTHSSVAKNAALFYPRLTKQIDALLLEILVDTLDYHRCE